MLLEEARAVLNKLLSLAEPEKSRSRDVTLPASRITGYPFPNAELNQLFHATLRQAENLGAIQLEWKRYYENHDLERIRLLDARVLAEFLDKPFLPDAIHDLFSDIDLSNAPTWLTDALDNLKNAWRQGRGLYGMKFQDGDRLKDVVKAVIALEQQPLLHTLDYRQFGARILGNSKRTRDIERGLASLYRHNWEASGFTDKDILQQLNIVPMAQPVLIKGPIALTYQGKTLDANIYPYIGVHDVWLETIEITDTPLYVLTIENLSSFLEYTRTIQDKAIILYTGGYPTNVLQRFYKLLVQKVNAPLFHWGDTDTHGFLILKVLQNQAEQKNITPHLMDQPEGEAYSQTDLKDLKRIKPVNAQVDALLDILIDRGTGLREQEEVVSESPIR